MSTKQKLLRAIASVTMAATMVGSVFAFTACKTDNDPPKHEHHYVYTQIADTETHKGHCDSTTGTCDKPDTDAAACTDTNNDGKCDVCNGNVAATPPAPAAEFDITFDVNTTGGKWADGTTENKTVKTSSKKVTAPEGTPTKDADNVNTYTFKGWGTTAGATDTVDLSTETFSAASTLYAIFDAHAKTPEPGPSTDTETGTVIASADYTQESAVVTGFTKNGSDSQSNQSGQCLNFGGAATKTDHSLQFSVEEASKLVIEVVYSQNNAGRYIDVFAMGGQENNEKILYGTTVANPTPADKAQNVTAQITTWTTGAATLYLGSHSSGIYLRSAKVTQYKSATNIVPVVQSINVKKETLNYTLVNESIDVGKSEVVVYTDTNAGPAALGYDVEVSLNKGAEPVADWTAVNSTGEYKIKATATKSEDVKTSEELTLNVAYPANVTPSITSADEMLSSGAESIEYNAEDVTLSANGVVLTSAAWDFTYAMAKTSGSEDPTTTDNKKFTLKEGSYTLTVTATRKGDTGTVKTATVTVNVNPYKANSKYKMTFAIGATKDANTQTWAKDTTYDGADSRLVLGDHFNYDSSKIKNKTCEAINGQHAVECKAATYMQIDIPANATNVKITLYAYSSNENRPIYISTSQSDPGSQGACKAKSDNLPSAVTEIVAQDLTGGTYYIIATSNAVYVCGFIVEYDISNEA